MDENEYVCPLCCEELDLSDREFYPCQCGYQVCMWCWHRIRETESGLCPACRTPYGEDPHQFTAVDVQKVLKANKEKEAAARKQRQSQNNNAVPGMGGITEDGTGEAGLEGHKDRTQLANMRVIRRNLVYAVGLPPNIATEEKLSSASYFGQYGKIAKIVLNRSQANLPDARRASASAYVTFAHKEDTLACILALDGFYMDNRNIRASYGTSKYCSSFIKNVRCSNPECTYLHEMGAAEDTFTKQEIQAGYVTSGRDVLARQQQIVAEQLRLANAGNTGGGPPRKRIGHGGPSGTGKAAANPVFPAPEFDEPAKPAAPTVPPPMPMAHRTASVPTGAALAGPPKHARAASVGPGSANSSVASKSPPLNSLVAPTAATSSKALPPLSAASVVAGVRPVTKVEAPDPHTTLTSLTPLKRNKTTKSVGGVGELNRLGSSGSSSGSLSKKKNGVALSSQSQQALVAPTATAPPITGPGSIGGDIIGPAPSAAAPSLGSLLGGEVFDGPLARKPSSSAVIGSGNDKWNAAPAPMAPGGLWDATPGGGAGNTSSGANSTSALASLLGISLPTGTGSLRDSWVDNMAPQPVTGPSPLASLNGTAMPVGAVGGPISGMGNGDPMGSSLIGGIPIGGASVGPPPASRPGAIGVVGTTSTATSAAAPNNGKSDMALLQSLLPGVHITSGNETAYNYSQQSPHGWNHGVGLNGTGGDALHWTNSNGPSSSTVGTIGRNPPQQPSSGPGIW